MEKRIFLLGIAALVILLGGCVKKNRVQKDISMVTGIPSSASLPKSRELTQQERESGNFRELEIKISGMSCPYCANGITTALLSEEGIIKADLTLEKKGGIVIYDATKLTKEDIVNAETFKGVYKATIIDDRETKVIDTTKDS